MTFRFDGDARLQSWNLGVSDRLLGLCLNFCWSMRGDGWCLELRLHGQIVVRRIGASGAHRCR